MGRYERSRRSREWVARYWFGMQDLNKLREEEPALERLYSELTGASEACARSVFMFVCCLDAENESRDESASVSR